ncbi:hypothetical protein GIB67_034923, partial [Kingdonia uniflora]
SNEAMEPMKNPKQGGVRTTIFVFVMTGMESIGFFANMSNLVLYCLFIMHFDLSASANTTTNYMGTAFLMALLGGVVSDSYMNRMNTTLFFGSLEILGYILMIIQSHERKLQPEPCLESTCIKGGKAVMFYSGLYLIALGAGGIKGAVPSLGADQFDLNDPKGRASIASFFNWFQLSQTLGAIIGVTVVVWVSTNKGYDKGYIISIACAFVGFLVLALGKPFYRVRVPSDNCEYLTLHTIVQVLFVMVKNINKKVPEDVNALYETRDEESHLHEELPHTRQFRLLDKAAIVPKDKKLGKWSVCTVNQVEEVKILTRMMPIILSTIIMNTCLAQLQTFSIQQGTLMDNRLGSFKVPSGSIPVIPFIFMTGLIPIYELLFVPIIRKYTGLPSGISHLQRVGVGLVLGAVSMGIAGLIEVKRRNQLVNHGNQIGLFWLAFHYGVFGIADMFTLVGLMEFFYTEAPKRMRSLSTSFTALSLAAGFYLSSALVNIINSVTGNLTKNKMGWLEGRDLNTNQLNLFYWFLAIISVLNFGNYLFWSNWYKYKSDVPVLHKEKDIRVHSFNGEEGNVKEHTLLKEGNGA